MAKTGIVTKAMKASFFEEMAAVQEQVDMKIAFKEGLNEEEPLFSEKVSISELNSFDKTLRTEIFYIRKGMYSGKIETKELYKNSTSTIENYWVTGGSSRLDKLYYVDADIVDGKTRQYIYDEETGDVYKIANTNVVTVVHSLKFARMYLDGVMDNVLLGYVMDTETKRASATNLLTGATEVINVYEPNLSGFDKNKTTLIYYQYSASSGKIVTSASKEITMSKYIELGRPRRIKVVGESITAVSETDTSDATVYTLYDYTNKIWANVKCSATTDTGVVNETWWTWIPRYAYKVDNSAESKVDIKFVNLNNKMLDEDNNEVTLPEGYSVHPSFNQNGEQQGIWMSKFEPSKLNDLNDNNTLAPNVNGFDPNNTVIMAYKSNGNDFKEIPLQTYKTLFVTEGVEDEIYSARKVAIAADNTVSIPTEETAEENIYYIYDYGNKIWANVKTIEDGVETWWVWIPRYAYYVNGNNVETLFINTEDQPFDSRFSMLPGNYTVHPAFNQNERNLNGIWMSKFEPSIDDSLINTQVFPYPTNAACSPKYSLVNNSDLTSTASIISNSAGNGTGQKGAGKTNWKTNIKITYYDENGASTERVFENTHTDAGYAEFQSNIENEIYELNGKTYYRSNYPRSKYPTIRIVQSWTETQTVGNTTQDVTKSNTVTLVWYPRVATKNNTTYKVQEKIYVNTDNKVYDSTNSIYTTIKDNVLTNQGYTVDGNSFKNDSANLKSPEGYWTKSGY